jgi:hypothetical protein
MSAPVLPVEPSTAASLDNPNSISNLIKTVEEQNKQAKADTKYDTKGGIYENFTNEITTNRTLSILTSFAITAGVLLLIGGLLPKSRK